MKQEGQEQQQQQQRPLYEDEEEWQRDQEEAIENLDKKIGWYKAGNGNGKDHRQIWSYAELYKIYQHTKEVTLHNMPHLWPGQVRIEWVTLTRYTRQC